MLEGYRYPGEFEPQSDVFVTWLPDSLGAEGYDAKKCCIEIVKNLVDHVQVHVNCGFDTSLDECRQTLSDAGIDVERIVFTRFDDGNFYLRDNGPNIMVDDKGGRVAINPRWSFYGIRDKDDPAMQFDRRAGVHEALTLDCFDIVSSDMVSEGGDREFNGDGVLIAIEDTECRKRNPEYTKAEVEAEYKRLYNLQKIIWLPKPLLEDDDFRAGPLDWEEDGTPIWGNSFAAHADEMCRFIAPDTILLAEITEEEAAQSASNRVTKERIDEAYKILANETDAHGNPFAIVRMPVSAPIKCVTHKDDPNYEMYKSFFDDIGGKAFDGTPWHDGDFHHYAATSYCNFLICNDVVLGQRYFHEGMDEVVRKKDEQAEVVLKRCFPDRTVVMIDALALNLTGGGVHCWTKNVACATRG